MDLLSIPLAGSPIESSLLLWWIALTQQLTEQELSLLSTHHDASWLPYSPCMSTLIMRGAWVSPTAETALIAAALAHLSPPSPPTSMPYPSAASSISSPSTSPSAHSC